MTTITINFKLHLAPGAVEKFSLDFKPRNAEEFFAHLELKLGELGLNFEVVYWRNEKGNLISLAQKPQKILDSATNKVALFVVANDSSADNSDLSSGESGDEVVIIDAPRQQGRSRHCGRRDRSRSRGFDRSRSRSHSRGQSGWHSRGPVGRPDDRCGRKRLADLEKRVALLEARSAKRPCFGRRARSASPQRGGRRQEAHPDPYPGAPFFGGSGPFGMQAPHHGFGGIGGFGGHQQGRIFGVIGGGLGAHHHGRVFGDVAGGRGGRGGHHDGAFGGRGGHNHGRIFGVIGPGIGGHYHGGFGGNGHAHGFGQAPHFGGF